MNKHAALENLLVLDLTRVLAGPFCTMMLADMGAKVIIAVTKSGLTARRVSKFRPAQTIVAATPEVKTFHQLALSWGVLPVLALHQNDTDRLFTHAIDCAKQVDIVSPGDRVVITAGVPLNIEGMTNLLKVQIVN